MLLCPPAFKNRLFRERLGFAWAGIRTVLRRERSFRTQCAAALAAAVVPVVLGLGPVWTALVALAIGLVLALEMVNAALEYLIDHLHPKIAEEIKHSKDAAAGAVLIASAASLAVATLMLLAWWIET